MKNAELFVKIDHLNRWWGEGIDETGAGIIYGTNSKSWYKNRKLHREDGPAMEFTNGDKFWYLNGERINCQTQAEFERLCRLKAFW